MTEPLPYASTWRASGATRRHVFASPPRTHRPRDVGIRDRAAAVVLHGRLQRGRRVRYVDAKNVDVVAQGAHDQWRARRSGGYRAPTWRADLRADAVWRGVRVGPHHRLAAAARVHVSVAHQHATRASHR